ncbi:hypothetical protein WJX81_000996 [Elliptochloris bilobata]|uniref:Uncharacterized protein n=1 Tax=Elliptochloris bilobata TaxID=381761 RepID=A0AAW1RBC7_9CHLO
MDACKVVVRALCGKTPVLDAKDAMLELQGKFEALKVLLLARLAEEESTGISLMRKHFTHAEMRVAVRKVLSGSRPMDLPQMLRPMAPDARAEWLALHGVPHIVQVLLINPRCRQYEAKFTAPLAALTAGVQPPAHKRAAASLLQCLNPHANEASHGAGHGHTH